MKIFILVIIMFIMTGVVYAQSSVYINQSGSGLALAITLDGDGSSVGTSSDITQIFGNNLDIVIDLDATSTVTGDVYITGDGASVDELNLTSQGVGVDYTLAIGASGDLSVGTSVIETRTNAGSSDGGTSVYTIGSVAGTGDYSDIDVILKGSNIDINLLGNSAGTSANKSTTAITMGTDSADVDFDIDKTGGGNHDVSLTISGATGGADFIVNQSGGGSHTTVMTSAASSASSIFTSTQSGSANHSNTLAFTGANSNSNFLVNQSGSNASIVSGTFAGASSSDVDIIITD
jgi:hypothetical protein